jgi:small subunit ribosomal protein S17
MPKRTLQGVVLSDKQDKTVIVSVERRFTHPVLKKTIRRSKTFHAHDEKNEFSIGDVVWIEEHRPISKLKRWLVVRGEKKKRTEDLVGEGVDTGDKKSRKMRAKAK